jgi:Tol biopolymer transport system component
MKSVAAFFVTLSVMGVTSSAATPQKNPPRLTYVVEGRGICLAGARPSQDIRLTRKRKNFQPSWSPDGRRFVFTNFAFLFVQDSRGHGRQIAGDTTHDDEDPAWSPDGRRIAFAAGAHGRRLQTIRPDGTGVRTLTQGQFDLYPAWSPDGAFIAFANEDGVTHTTSVHVIDSAGMGRRLLVENGTEPSWSPDGRSIVFARVTSGSSNLFIIGVDGTGERLLTGQLGSEYQPAWSPDGSWVAFTRLAPEQTNTDIAVVRPDGTDAHVVRDLPVSLSDPTWRPPAPRRRGKGPCLS